MEAVATVAALDEQEQHKKAERENWKKDREELMKLA